MTSSSSTSTSPVVCIECEDAPAQMSCPQCGDAFCALCYAWLHRSGQRAQHTPVAPDGTALDTSGDARALEGTTEHFVKQLQRASAANTSSSAAGAHTHASNGEALDDLVVSVADEVRARRLEQQCRFVPLRLTDDERALLKLLDGALKVSMYTDKVDVTTSYGGGGGFYGGSFSMMGGFGSVSKKTDVMRDELRNVASLLLGMVVVQDYKRGKNLVKHSIEENAEFFQTIFEIGRRFKIMNPDKMRTTYGKLMHILQDAISPGMLEFDVVAPIKTVHSLLLKRRGSFALLADPDLPRAIAALNDAGVSADDHQAAVAAKRGARARLIERHTVSASQLSAKVPVKKAKKSDASVDVADDGDATTAPAPQADGGGGGGGGVFSSFTRPIMNLWSGSGSKRDDTLSATDDESTTLPALTPDELILVLESLADSESHLLACHAPVADVLSWLERLFDPTTSDNDETDLAIKYGSNGCKLTHSHSQQFQFVRQSLMLWCEVQKQMFRLWLAADADMLSPQGYRLVNTGQGLNRVQPAPCVSAAMSDILGIVKNQVGRAWVGLSVVHLGDRDVPNALFFIDKYTQVPRILGPISRTVHAVDRLARNDRTRHFVDFFLTPEQLAAFQQPDANQDERHETAVLQTRRRILRSFYRLGFNGDGDDGGSCIAEGTPITLANGAAALPIEQLVQQVDSAARPMLAAPIAPRESSAVAKRVRTGDGASVNVSAIVDDSVTLAPFVPYSAGVFSGVKECVELLLEDGRKLVLTPDHRVLTSTGEWVAASKLRVGEQRVSVSPLVAPLDAVTADEAAFQLVCSNGVRFTMATPTERAKTLAFASLLGFVLANDSVGHGDRTRLVVGCKHDVDAVQRSIELVTGSRGTEEMQQNNPVSIYGGAMLAHCCNLPGMPVGGRMDAPASLPRVVSQPDTPVAFVRAFLGGYFGGGDGHTLTLCSKGNNTVAMNHVSLSHSCRPVHEAAMVAHVNEVLRLLERCGVEGGGIVDAYDDVRYSESPMDGLLRREVRMVLRDSLSFAEHVGFLFCVEKQLRLGAGCAWLRLGVGSEIPDFLESIGAGAWFDPKTNMLDQGADVLPMLALKVVSRRDVGERRVFDLSVPLTESFLANGVAVHNCIDGRLTSAWNWCSQVEGKIFFSVFQLAGFGGFDGSFQQ